MDILLPALVMAIIGVVHSYGGHSRGASLLHTVTPQSTLKYKEKILVGELVASFIAGLGATLVWAAGGLLYSGLLVAFHRTPDLPAIMLVVTFYFIGYFTTSIIIAIKEIFIRSKTQNA